ncbi:MAG: hypothetical protein GVY04_21755 [Cyanobacteria bacterium]|jgi:hypothetical protein|nr:hypothetical protein [Cyanobacteria bacterium GSL.Bin1]
MNKLVLGITAFLSILGTTFISAEMSISEPTRNNSFTNGDHYPIPNLNGVEAYAKARKLVMAEGWQPVNYSGHYFSIHRTEWERQRRENNYWIRERGYHELKECAGTGAAPCVFEFKDPYGNRLRLVTIGQYIPEGWEGYDEDGLPIKLKEEQVPKLDNWYLVPKGKQ